MFRYRFLRVLTAQRTAEFGRLCYRRSSYSETAAGSTQRLDSFIDPKVQTLLKELTGKDYSRIFRNRKIGQTLRSPKINFMTKDQLEDTIREAEGKVEKLLQMPPVVRPRKIEEEVLSFDPRIQGHDESSYVFTDISLNSSDTERLIVVRDLDGTLKHADRTVRMKMNNIYFPFEGRNFYVPKMFSDPLAMKAVLDRATPQDNTYEFILDRACLQFDPDDPQYISIIETTYDHINEMKDYDLLKSTRHYGHLVFYLTRTRKMDDLLIFNIQNERIHSDAALLVSLFTLIFPESRSRLKIEESNRMGDDDIVRIRHYIQLDSIKTSELELCLNAYEEIKRSREEFEKGLESAHGF